jgi:hypothetical protein
MRKSLKRYLKKEQESDFNMMKYRRATVHPLHWENHKINQANNNSNKKKSPNDGGIIRDLSHNIKTAFLDNIQKSMLQ